MYYKDINNERQYSDCKTITLNGSTISNPTQEQIAEAGWTYFTPKVYTPELTEEQLYERRVVELIRERYDINEELAVLRQRDSKPEEFAEYNSFCEECKATAKAEREGEESLTTEGVPAN